MRRRGWITSELGICQGRRGDLLVQTYRLPTNMRQILKVGISIATSGIIHIAILISVGKVKSVCFIR